MLLSFKLSEDLEINRASAYAFQLFTLASFFYFFFCEETACGMLSGCLGNSWLCWTHTRCLSLIPSNLGGGLAGKQSQKITSMGYQLVNKKGESKLLSGDSYCY